MDRLLQIAVSGVVTGAVYGVSALGFTIVYNASRIMNFAHGEFVMMGALLSAMLGTVYQLNAALAVVLSVIVVTALGIALDRFCIQQARRKTVMTAVMITIGAGIAFRGLMVLAVGRDVLFALPFSGLPSLVAVGVFLPAQGLWILIMLAAVSCSLWYLFARTRLGKAMRSASENPRAATLCGIDPRRMSMLAFALAASSGALAGAFVAPISSAFFESGLYFGLKGFAAAMLGGLGNPLGAIVGGLLIGAAETLSAGYVTSNFKDAVALGILLVLLLLKPDGLLGRAEVKRV